MKISRKMLFQALKEWWFYVSVGAVWHYLLTAPKDCAFNAVYWAVVCFLAVPLVIALWNRRRRS